MKLPLFAACLVAGSTWSFAFANQTTTTNPKTASRTFTAQQTSGTKDSQDDTLRQDEALRIARKLALLRQSSSQLAQGGTAAQPASPSTSGGTTAVLGGDDCSVAEVITGVGTFGYDCTNATTGTPALTCGIGGRDVWFSWVAPSTGDCTYRTCGQTTLDTVVAAWSGSGCPAGTPIICNDDNCSGTFQSSVTFPVVAGNNYMLQIGGFNGANIGVGTFTLSVVYTPPPANDDCSAPTAISGFGTFPFDNVAATTGTDGQAEALCNQGGQIGVYRDVWYEWTATSTGTARVSTCTGTTMDSKLAAYAGPGCPASGTALACNDNFCGAQSTITFPTVAGNSYMIQLGKFGVQAGAIGTFIIDTPPPPPAGDDCSTPIVISGFGTFPFDNTSATTGAEGQTEFLCLAYSTTAMYRDVWYRWTATNTGTARVKTCGGTTMDSRLAAYAGSSCPTAGSALACNDDFCSLQSQIEFTVAAGSTYMIQLAKYSTAAGVIGTFIIEAGPPPPPTYLCEPGVGGVVPCPCGNPPSGSGRGCDNSDLTGGALINSTGAAFVSADTLVLTTTGQSNTTTLVWQGDADVSPGVASGQGVRCIGGNLLRLYGSGGGLTGSGFSITVPPPGNPSISAKSALLGDTLAPGMTRYYFVAYRDPTVLGGCPANATYNYSSATAVIWN